MAAVALFEEPLPSDDDIDNLLHPTAHSNAAITDSLLAQHTTADLGEFSAKLTALVSMSKGFDPHLVKPGLCEKALGFFRTEREQMLAHTQTVNHARVTISDADTNTAIADFKLTEDDGNSTAVQMGSFLRKGNDWHFEAVGRGYQKGWASFVQAYGLQVGSEE